MGLNDVHCGGANTRTCGFWLQPASSFAVQPPQEAPFWDFSRGVLRDPRASRMADSVPGWLLLSRRAQIRSFPNWLAFLLFMTGWTVLGAAEAMRRLLFRPLATQSRSAPSPWRRRHAVGRRWFTPVTAWAGPVLDASSCPDGRARRSPPIGRATFSILLAQDLAGPILTRSRHAAWRRARCPRASSNRRAEPSLLTLIPPRSLALAVSSSAGAAAHVRSVARQARGGAEMFIAAPAGGVAPAWRPAAGLS